MSLIHIACIRVAPTLRNQSKGRNSNDGNMYQTVIDLVRCGNEASDMLSHIRGGGVDVVYLRIALFAFTLFILF